MGATAIAGSIFAIFSLVISRRFVPSPIIITDPTHIISAIAASVNIGEINTAASTIAP